MKILFSTDSIQRGGKERQMFLLSKILTADGHRVDILTLKKQSPNFIVEYGFPENQLFVNKESGRLSTYRFMRDVYGQGKYDIVFAWDLQTALVGLLSHRKFKFIFINGCIQHGVRLFKFRFLLRSLICMLSPYVVANSLAGLKANNLMPGPKRFVLYNGIEGKFRQAWGAERIERARREWIPGYRERPGKVFISVANMVPFKDYRTVFLALKGLRGSYPFYYLIMGDGPLRGEYEAQVREAALSGNVVFLGQRENVGDFLSISDFFIHSSRGEGISNAIVEAMFAGLPVIATRVGGIPETVYAGSSVLFEYGDHRMLLAILKTVEERFSGFNAGDAKYETHLELFSPRRMLMQFYRIIDLVKKDYRCA